MKILKALVISIFLTSFITISNISAEETKRDCDFVIELMKNACLKQYLQKH